MIVSPTLKFIFVHIPKNGGTTIETLLMDHLDSRRDLHVSEAAVIGDNRDVQGINGLANLKKHITAPLLRGALPPGQYDSLFSFAFSRNPFSRCYSAYGYIKARAEADIRVRRKNPKAALGRDRSKLLDMSFDELCTDLDDIARNHGLFRPQSYWLPDADSVDFVGRLEHLSEDLGQIYRRLGLPADQLDDLPVANMKSTKGAWRGMAPASVDAIRRFYARDFERFGYSPDFDADEGAPPRQPIHRDPVRAGHALQINWKNYLRAQAPAKPRKSPRPPKPLRTRAERGLE